MIKSPLKIALLTGVVSILAMQVNIVNPLASSGASVRLEFGSVAHATPRYIPRQGNVPRRTQGTGARGCLTETGLVAADTRPTLTLLVAESHEGLTVADRPAFFWHVSSHVDTPVEFALVQHGNPTPVWVQQFPSLDAGITKVQLPDNAPALIPGEQYRWSVAFVCNPMRRSSDTIAQAWVEHIQPSSELTAQLATTTSDEQKAEVYAQHGLWYDSLMTLVTAHTTHITDETILQDVLSLLEQVGLGDVAAQERPAFRLSSTTLVD